MKVTVEGVVTSYEVTDKDEKKVTNVYLAQPGERQQVLVRLEGDHSEALALFDRLNVTGRLMSWKTRDGVGSMVLAESSVQVQ